MQTHAGTPSFFPFFVTLGEVAVGKSEKVTIL